MDTYTGNGLSLKTMQDEVCRRCFKDTATFRGLITTWINEAQQKINAIANGRWWWLEKEATASVAADDDEIELPADFFELIDESSVRDTTNDVMLRPMNHLQFEQSGNSSAGHSGQPDRFCLFMRDTGSLVRKLRFLPVSDGTRTVSIHYYKVLPDFSDNDDVSLIPYWYQHLLIEFAVMRGQEYRQMAQLAALARGNWVDGLHQLLVEADSRNHLQGSLRPKWRW